jgi:hypothetical protein
MLGRQARLLALALALCANSQPAGAADPAPDREQAEALFERGKQAMSVGSFAEARELLQRSLELVPRPSAAFNLAVALRGMGRPKQSADVLSRLRTGQFGALPADKRSDVENLERAVRRDIAHVTVAASGASHVEVRIDGVRVASIEAGRVVTIEVDPGERVLSLSAKLKDSVERKLLLAPGGKRSVSVQLVPSRAALDGERSRSVLASPWFWAGSVTLVVGAVVGGYLLLQDRQRDPVSDPEFKIVQTLRW